MIVERREWIWDLKTSGPNTELFVKKSLNVHKHVDELNGL